MIDPASDNSRAARWPWFIGVIIVAAAIFWFAAPLETGKKVASVQPVTQSTDWAIEPTGPAVPVNLPKTTMTNAPEKAP